MVETENHHRLSKRDLNDNHCFLYRHIMLGNRGDVGTDILPSIYSRRDKFCLQLVVLRQGNVIGLEDPIAISGAPCSVTHLQ